MSSIFTVNLETDLVWEFQGTKYAIKRYDSALGAEGAQELDIMQFVNGEWDRFAGVKDFTNADVIAAGGVVAFLVLAIAAMNALFKLRGMDPDVDTTPPLVVPDPTLTIPQQIDQTIPYLFGVEVTATGVRIVRKVLPGEPGYVAPVVVATPMAAASSDAPAADASASTSDIPADLAAAIAAGTPGAPSDTPTGP